MKKRKINLHDDKIGYIELTDCMDDDLAVANVIRVSVILYGDPKQDEGLRV
jgi:hypothetical protein|tara:strand:+ start:306 stop:458 length:153 start_codon:yes stop_codon:yes gene_type:complete